jgi:hypothetical protein
VPLVTALYLSIALVVVAFVARDVVLRVLAEQAAQRLDSDRHGSLLNRCDGIEEAVKVDRSMLHVWVGEAAKHGDAIEALKGEVSVLKTTSSLRGPRS